MVSYKENVAFGLLLPAHSYTDHFYTITDCIKEKTKLFCGNVNCVMLCKQNVNRIIKTVVETKQPNN